VWIAESTGFFTSVIGIQILCFTSFQFEITKAGEAVRGTQLRGLGTDVAIVSSMVFLAQFILSMCMGSIVSFFGTTTTVVSVAAILSLFGAIAATQVMYLEL
jgi:solute carrier family 45 protein 1/2/4